MVHHRKPPSAGAAAATGASSRTSWSSADYVEEDPDKRREMLLLLRNRTASVVLDGKAAPDSKKNSSHHGDSAAAAAATDDDFDELLLLPPFSPPKISSACRAGLERLYASNRVESNFGLALAVESSSHPSGLASLYAQPYVYGGATWNAHECPHKLCLAGTSASSPDGEGGGGGAGDIVFAAACVPSECHAQDLVATTDLLQALHDVAERHTNNIIRTHSVPDVDSDSQQLWQEYSVLHRRIAEINHFLVKGWTCGNWQPGAPLVKHVGVDGISRSYASLTAAAEVADAGADYEVDDDVTAAAAAAASRHRRSSSPSWRPVRKTLSSKSDVLAGTFGLLLACWVSLVLMATAKMSRSRARRRQHKKNDGDGDGDDYEDSSNSSHGCVAAADEEEGLELPSDADTDKQTMASWSREGESTDEEEEMALIERRAAEDGSNATDDDDDDDDDHVEVKTNGGYEALSSSATTSAQFCSISPTSVVAPFLPSSKFGLHHRIGAHRNADQHILFWSCLDLRTHWQSLFVSSSSTSPSSSDNRPTAVLEGLRVLSLLWIIAGHVLATVSSTNGVINPSDLLPPHGMISTMFGQIFFASRLAVDTFFCISGFLLVHVMERKLAPKSSRQRGKSYGWRQVPLVVVSRIVRLLPLYGLTLGFYILLAPRFHSFLGNAHDQYTAPFWYQWQHLLRPCREWYWNLLFVNNFLPWDRPTSDTCFYHSWYIAVDMQLFLLAQPILVLLFRRGRAHDSGCQSTVTPEEQEPERHEHNRKSARRVALALIAIFSVMTMYLAYTRHWSLNTLDGAAVARYDVEAYAKPHVRAPSYIAGMYLALLLPFQRFQQMLPESSSLPPPGSSRSSEGPGHRKHSVTAIILSLVVMLFVVFCTVSGAYARRPCQYQEWPQIHNCGSTWSAPGTWLYTATSRTLWVGALVVLLYNSVGTNQHFLAACLSCRFWTPLSHLTFAAYLIHPIVLFVLQLGKSQKQVFSVASLGMIFISVTVVSFLAALAAALFVELPAATLWKEYIVKPRLEKGCDPSDEKDQHTLQVEKGNRADKVARLKTSLANYGSIAGIRCVPQKH